MNQVDNKPMNKTQIPARKILDFLIGFLGSLIAGNLGLLLSAQFDPQRMWLSYFKWFWILVLAGLAGRFFIKKRFWISFGIVAAGILMAF
ncbi:MAG TPA: hypothetical protein VK249_12875 [Anaerolineales bacterium]|nr:hypothetical protein [Anaerolineales bacterium]